MTDVKIKTASMELENFMLSLLKPNSNQEYEIKDLWIALFNGEDPKFKSTAGKYLKSTIKKLRKYMQKTVDALQKEKSLSTEQAEHYKQRLEHCESSSSFWMVYEELKLLKKN